MTSGVSRSKTRFATNRTLLEIARMRAIFHAREVDARSVNAVASVLSIGSATLCRLKRCSEELLVGRRREELAQRLRIERLLAVPLVEPRLNLTRIEPQQS